MYTANDLTIGISSRERYKIAPLCLEVLKETCPDEVKILYIDADVPQIYRLAIEEKLRRFQNVTKLTFGDYLLPIQATKKIIDNTKTSLLALVENDVCMRKGWLEIFLNTANLYQDFNFISPEILEKKEIPLAEGGSRYKEICHFNPRLSVIEELGDGRVRSKVERIPGNNPQTDISRIRYISHMERHAFFGRTECFRRLGELPDNINTREQIDIALRIHRESMKILLVPSCKVEYIEAMLDPEEIPHYRRRWSLDVANMSNEYIRKTWNLVDYVDSTRAVGSRIAKLKGTVELDSGEVVDYVPTNPRAVNNLGVNGPLSKHSMS